VEHENPNRVGVRERLGEILVRKGRITPDQLESAIIDARESGVRLGTYLVDSRTLYEEDISIALADQFGLRYVVIDVRHLDPELGGIVPEKTARRLNVLPLTRSDDRVRLAIADPTDVVLLDELRMSLDIAFELVVGDPSAIRAGIDRIYEPACIATALIDVEQPEEPDVSGQQRIDELGDAESAPAVEEVNRLLRRAIELGASDLHFVPHKNDLHESTA
jgi:type IV pilus assembly protein PilB